ncbi:MAG TPA: extracellular solute-binding protein [Candidatus Binatia bacterium]|nr:extracellular solute-binding protein [Candidatus Binatia bacterium]
MTIEWWHISTGDPGKTDFQNIADAYMAAHPNVKIEITILENEAFKAKLQTTMQSGQVPDLFQSWGGGTMAAQAEAGLLKDITDDIASWKDSINPGALSIYQYNGRQYGIPWDLGMIGFWYNKDLFARAGISAPPTTWEELLADVDKLKAAGIVPYALAGKDKWPGMHLWTYLVLRIGGRETLTEMIQSKNWNTDACRQAGAEVAKLVAKDPFQPGFLTAPYDKGEAAAMGNGEAAMELMGQWAPSVQASNSTSGKGIGDALAWFPFPAVTGGKGDPNDGVGGGNGIAVGRDAPPEAIDFLKFFSSLENAKIIGEHNIGLPTTKGAESSVADPQLRAVLDARAKAEFVQLYLDQATSPAMGAAINDATAGLFAGTSTPEQVCQAITEAAANE